jgi:hypothetical protein
MTLREIDEEIKLLRSKKKKTKKMYGIDSEEYHDLIIEIVDLKELRSFEELHGE